jgi:hypothetical protein
MANIIARADIVKSVPWHTRLTMSIPLATHQGVGEQHPDVISNSCGAEPVRPLGPSTMTKSGAMPCRGDRLADRQNSVRAPMHSLIPTGLPPNNRRSTAMNCKNSVGVENALCAGGETTVRPIGTSRVAAISGRRRRRCLP